MKNLFILLLTLFAHNPLSAQNESIDQKQTTLVFPKILLTKYNQTELNEIIAIDSVKFKTILYYYTSSFQIQQIECDECVTFDLTDFDISMYENKRSKNESVTITNNKFGYVVTLTSVSDLLYKLPIHSGTPNQNLEDDE